MLFLDAEEVKLACVVVQTRNEFHPGSLVLLSSNNQDAEQVYSCIIKYIF